MSAVLPGHRDRYLRGRGQPGRPATCDQSPGRAQQAGRRFAISELTLTECLVTVLGPGGGQRLSDFFPVLPWAEPRRAGPDYRDARRASAIRGGHTYPAIPPAVQALRAGRRPPSRRSDRVRLRRVSDQRQPVGDFPEHHGRGTTVIGAEATTIRLVRGNAVSFDTTVSFRFGPTGPSSSCLAFLKKPRIFGNKCPPPGCTRPPAVCLLCTME